MANKILNELIADGLLIHGNVFASLATDFADVLERRKERKKAEINAFQTKEMRNLYKSALKAKHKENDCDFLILDWNNYTTC